MVYSSSSGAYLSLRIIPPLRGELEVEHFSRAQLISFAAGAHDVSRVSLFIILFIDDFGVHRNMYRALKAFY